ncbi:MAG TPA: hypothetical protein VGT44_08645 [Ktedonobacteraceae bacterium]|nr:hypothetical protein [Ktedonobacteraceae bacterium]
MGAYSTAVASPADAFQHGSAGRLVEAEPEPIVIGLVDDVGGAAQGAVGAVRAAQAVAAFAPADQDDFLALFV